MARTPENTFVALVNKYVSLGVHREKMYNPLRRGTPDMWYSGYERDLWVEYKWGNNWLSPHQEAWLRREIAHGRNVAVAHGGLNEGVCTLRFGEAIFDSSSNNVETYRHAKELARRITLFCGREKLRES